MSELIDEISQIDNANRGKYTLKIDFDKPLTPAVLIDVLKGIENLVDPTDYILNNISGSKALKIRNVSIAEIREGSIIVDLLTELGSGFDAVEIAKSGAELFKEARNMTPEQILSILVPFVLGGFGLKWLNAHYDAKKNGTNINTIIKNSTITVNGKDLVDNIQKILPNSQPEHIEEFAEQVSTSIDKMEEKKPRAYAKGKKAVVELSHPGGIAANSISFGDTEQLEKEGSLPVVMGGEIISHIPEKYTPPSKEEPKKQKKTLKDVRIKPVMSNTEGGQKWTARLEQEGEPFHELPFYVDDEEKRKMILDVINKTIYADIEVELIIKTNGDTQYLTYIFQDFGEDTKKLLRQAGYRI